MELISSTVEASVRQTLSKMREVVRLQFYPVANAPASDAMKTLLTELSSLSPGVMVQTMAGEPERLLGEANGERESATTVMTVQGHTTGMRFLGFPGGHEFGAFLQALVAASTDAPAQVSQATRSFLEGLSQPLHFQVFTTPT